MKITTFLFDLDDTIIDSRIYAEIYQPILWMIKKRGIDVEQEVRKLGLEKNRFGRVDTGDLCKKLGLLKEYYHIFSKHLEVIPSLKKEIIPVLKKLKGKKIGIISNSMRQTIELYLNQYKLGEYFAFIFSFEDAGCKKHNDECWKKLIKMKSLNPKECLVIGDNPIDDEKIPKKLGFNTFLIKESKDLKQVLNFINK